MAEIKQLKYFCDGEWRTSTTDKYMDVYNPSTGEVIAQTPCCTEQEVEDAIAAAKAAFPAWSNTPVMKRVQVLYKFRELLIEHMDELATLCATEHGKVLAEAKGDILKVKEPVELALNFPGMIPMGWMTPCCIAAGNTIVLKLASMTPMTAMRLCELLVEAGLPKGVVNLVTCSRVEADIFLRHPDVRGITFVGSTKVGLHVYSTAAANGKRVQCLCEAKNHALVLEDAALERSARGIINSSFGCAGERCMALPVVVAQESIADKLVALIKQYASELKIGPAYLPDSKLGPVISKKHKESVLNWINKGLEEGATMVLDGRDVKVEGYENGFYIGPTILDNVTEEMTVGTQEIFGPVLCIKRVKNFEEGLALMNRNPFANGSVIFTQSGYYAREFTKRTDGGMTGVNVGIPVPVGVFPFTGHKKSFFGDLHCLGKDAFRFFTETKAVTVRWFDEEEKKATDVDTWDGSVGGGV